MPDPATAVIDRTKPTWSASAQAAENAREKIMAAASTLFSQNGFSATGIDTIVARSGSAKATLYRHFESKDALIAAVLEAEGQAWRRWFFGRMERIEGGPKARLNALFHVLEEWICDPCFHGCPFIDAVSEHQSEKIEIRRVIDAHKRHLFDWFKANALELNSPDPDNFARTLVIIFDGAIVAAQYSHDRKVPKTAQRLLDLTFSPGMSLI